MGVEAFAGRLLPREKIIWSGRPRQSVMFTARDLFLVPFSILWSGFAIFWTAAVLSAKAPWFMALVGILFVGIGLFMIFGRLLFDAWLRRHTSYALTDRRILILRGGPLSSFTAVALDRLPEVNLTERKAGRGTIRFGPPVASWFRYGNGIGIWIPSLDPVAQFLEIDDVRRVFALVQQRTHTP